MSSKVLLTAPGSTELEAGSVKPDSYPSNTESSMQYAFMITHEDMVPRNYTEAMASPCAGQWQAAIEAEVRSLIELGTWIVVDRPKHKSLQSCAFIFRKKYTSINDHVKYKTRLVAHGYRQYMVQTTGKPMLRYLAVELSGIFLH